MEKHKKDYLKNLEKLKCWIKAAQVTGISKRSIHHWRKTDCAYCYSLENIQQDHIEPISLGGQHTADNVVPACRFCNLSKGSKSLIIWIGGF